jgi:hypothetical protein
MPKRVTPKEGVFMKRTLILPSAIAVFALTQTAADAETSPTPVAGPVAGTVIVKGTISALPVASLAPPGQSVPSAFSCSDLSVNASGSFTWGTPAQTFHWARTVTPTGSWGSCSYLFTMPDRGGSFDVNVANHYTCTFLAPAISPSTVSVGALPNGSTKVQDFKITSLTCITLK